MSWLSDLPLPILSQILNRDLDFEDVVNFATTCKRVLASVRTVEKEIRVDLSRRAAAFVQSLPDYFVGAQNRVGEENVGPLVAASEIPIQSCDLNTVDLQPKGPRRGVWQEIDLDLIYKNMSHGLESQVTVLRLEGCLGGLDYLVRGYVILRLDRALCSQLGGQIDLMKFLRLHPLPMDHPCSIKVSSRCRLTVGMVRQPIRSRASWEILQCEAIQITLKRGCQDVSEPLLFNHIGVGIIIALPGPLVETFTLRLNYREASSIRGRHCWIRSRSWKSYNLPFKVSQCYYIQLDKKVNFSKVDRLSLRLQLYRPLAKDTEMSVTCIHTNFLRFDREYMGVAFAN